VLLSVQFFFHWQNELWCRRRYFSGCFGGAQQQKVGASAKVEGLEKQHFVLLYLHGSLQRLLSSLIPLPSILMGLRPVIPQRSQLLRSLDVEECLCSDFLQLGKCQFALKLQ
jgi:hypothetical protein